MVPSEEDRNGSTGPALRLVSADRQHRSRDGSRQREERSKDRRKKQHRSRSRQNEDVDGRMSRKSSVSTRSGKNRKRRDDSAPRSEGHNHINGTSYEYLTGESSSGVPLEQEGRSRSNSHYKADSRVKDLSKEIAAAELEARRLSLARRPSAPNIPLPGQALHGKSASESNAPPLYRAQTDDYLARYGESRMRRPSTPRAMQVTPSILDEHQPETDLLPRSTFTPKPEQMDSPRPGTSHSGKQRSHSASRSAVDEHRTHEDIQATLAQLPRHPAYDARVSRSRDHSRNRSERDHSRGVSRDRPRVSPPLEDMGSMIIAGEQQGPPRPPVLPELQHLMTPPPPPPPPAPPKDRPSLAVRTDSLNAARIPLPLSAIPRDDGPPSAHPGLGHRRGRSGNGGSENQFMGKIKNFAGKMRSASQNRDNMTRSPPPQWQAETHHGQSPYETNTGFSHQQMPV
jgi:hypothetical protein